MLKTRAVIFIVLILLNAVILGTPSCGRSKKGTLLPPETALQLQMPVLPAPADLIADPSTPHLASYSEESLVRKGCEFQTGLPYELVTVDGDFAEYTPAWTATGDCAYAIYRLETSGFDRSPELHYGFDSTPVDYVNVWIGLANYSGNRWEWYECDQSCGIDLDSITPYQAPEGPVYTYVAVVLTGDHEESLSFVRLGDPQATAVLTVTPDRGIGTLRVTMNAEGSSAAAGTITNFEWDTDGDGNYEVGSGTTGEVVCGVASPGERMLAVRVTTDLGEQVVDHAPVYVTQPWARSWGTAGSEMLRAVAADDNGVYACGHMSNDTTSDDVLLVKYSLDGQLRWCKSWQVMNDDSASDIAVYDGNIYTVGSTKNTASGDPDILVQCWDQDGGITWTRVLGIESPRIENAVALVIYNGVLYIAGSAENDYPLGDMDILVLAMDTTGAVLWSELIDRGGDEYGSAVSVYKPGLDDPVVSVAGTEYDGQYITYARFTSSGSFSTLRRWGHTDWTITVKDLHTSMFLAEPQYIAGSIDMNTGMPVPVLVKINSVGDPVVSSYPATALPGRIFGFFNAGDQTYALNTHFNGSVLMSLYFSGMVKRDRIWSETEHTLFEGIAPYPNQGGIVLAGYADLAHGRNFEDAEVTKTTLPTYSWMDLTPVSDSVTLYVNSPNAPPADVTSIGVENNGGGGNDAIVVARSLEWF